MSADEGWKILYNNVKHSNVHPEFLPACKGLSFACSLCLRQYAKGKLQRH